MEVSLKEKVDKKLEMTGLDKQETKPKMREGQVRQGIRGKYEGQGRQETKDERDRTR